ncbi:hypothetical protein GW819_01205 [Candidatus Gracilibacteria bacterium]|nr:hypothetical protein [bacterium]NDK19436.1 hypothetical protein [Candidatus Gracilibacteria bacterium]OIO75998.1 MAG: hypothetical protein AUJ87_03760 [Candidatus Gracilibacteria bacterium CG1_02_38_174]PIQ12166.1 MAG: hypothetical protein COW68_00620 [Candidatus Gracilibacteria bacterium CG18_big_fil_WC_8_21_14_2_50_38_16]PJC56632.1 MAG: hypothetical protein CO024_02025 [Candidatus Gracilibacteria bacterium CG_4_9_14_0_2_um_filter_38_7]
MNNFFIDLDSDIQTVKKPQNSPMNPVENPQKHPANMQERKNAKPPFKPRNEKTLAREKNVRVPTTYITEIRSQMGKAGTVVIIFKADEKTKTLLGHLKLETRGFVFLDEVREAHKTIIKKARASYEDTLKDVPDIEEKDLIKIIRRDMEIFLLQKMERNPVIIPIIIYV